jgi:hypothetical protein
MKKLSLSIIIMSSFSLGEQSASGIDIYQQRLDPIVPISQSMNTPVDNRSLPNRWWEELDTVRSKSDSIKFLDCRVRVIGKYKVETSKPNSGSTGDPNFQGTYTTASIVLTDGTEIPIFPTYHKQSLRSPEEVKIYAGKIVSVVGRINLQSDRPGSANSTQSIMITSFDRIWLDLEP